MLAGENFGEFGETIAIRQYLPNQTSLYRY